METGLLAISLWLTFMLNIPFGYWRAHAKARGDRKEWFISIHAPVPIVFLIRRLIGAGYSMIPLFILAFFMGQYLGGKVNAAFRSRNGWSSRCLPCDVVKATSSSRELGRR